MKFNSTSKNPNTSLESKKVKYNQTTGLFSNPDRTIAFQSYEDANRYNNSLDETPGETPMQDALKNIRKPLKDGSTGVKYKNAFERNEEVWKERLNKAWGINQHPAEKYYDNKMKEIDKKGTSYLAKHLKKPIPKVRQETSLERIERFGYENSSDATLKKPAHMNNPNIVTFENWGQRPKAFKHEDKSTYPSDMDQRQKMNTWDMLVESAKMDPKDENSKDTKRMLMKQYYNKKGLGREYMNDSELKLIGKHKSQLEKPKPVIENPSLSFEPLLKPAPTYVPEPEVSVEEIINQKSGIAPGISEDLVKLNADIAKNIDYVLGREDEKEESKNEKTQLNKEETYD